MTRGVSTPTCGPAHQHCVRRKCLEMLHFSSCFLERHNYLDPVRATHPLVVLLARLYHPVARWRVERLNARFPVEIRVAQRLGLYPRQG